MVIFILLFAASLLIINLLIVAGIAELSVHPPVIRRPCDTDGMALQVARTTGAAASRIEIQAADGITLSAWWLQAKSDPNRAVLLCHGVADTAFRVMGPALMFLRNGDSVLAPDNRGHGRSGGVVTYGVREAGDIAAWQAWLTARGIRHCFGFGESLGASALLQSLSSGAAFTAIVAECPFASFGRVGWDRVMHVLKHLLPPPVARPVSDLLVTEVLLYLRLRYGVDLALARSVDAVKNITTRILLIHGMADYETPVHHSQEIAAANPNIQLWLVPDAKHTGGYPVQPVEFERRVMDLMKPGDDAE